jgi:hypothetical protein
MHSKVVSTKFQNAVFKKISLVIQKEITTYLIAHLSSIKNIYILLITSFRQNSIQLLNKHGVEEPTYLQILHQC